MAKVFITHHQSALNYDLAKRFGVPVPVVEEEFEVNPIGVGAKAKNEAIFANAVRVMREYRPGKDYILLGGSPVCIFLAGMLVGQECRHNVLKWDNRKRDYEVCKV